MVAETPFTVDGNKALVDGWNLDSVRHELPEYGPMVGRKLLALLSSEGLIADNTIQNPVVHATQFLIRAAGHEILRRLGEPANNDALSEPQ